jgi:hypothetical protein
MVKVNLVDTNFVGEPSSCHKGINKYIEWDRGDALVSRTVFFTDNCLQHALNCSDKVKRKVAWILEPRAIHPHVYDWIDTNYNHFDYVLTFDKHLLDKGKNFLYYPHGRCWINDYAPTVKTKFCSIIASTKNFTEGHQLRHKVIQQLAAKHGIDVFGYGYKPIENKIAAQRDYYYTIVIENSIQDYYWTEKVVDAFATETIPLFWGSKSVDNKFYTRNGALIHWNTIEELDQILNKKEELIESYNFLKDDGKLYQNKQTVESYRIPEDWIFENYSFLFDDNTKY